MVIGCGVFLPFDALAGYRTLEEPTRRQDE